MVGLNNVSHPRKLSAASKIQLHCCTPRSGPKARAIAPSTTTEFLTVIAGKQSGMPLPSLVKYGFPFCMLLTILVSPGCVTRVVSPSRWDNDGRTGTSGHLTPPGCLVSWRDFAYGSSWLAWLDDSLAMKIDLIGPLLYGCHIPPRMVVQSRNAETA